MKFSENSNMCFGKAIIYMVYLKVNFKLEKVDLIDPKQVCAEQYKLNL